MKPPGKVVLASVLGVALATVALGTTLVASAEPPKAGYAPDPPVVEAAKHWVFTVEVNSGTVTLGSTRAQIRPTLEGTPRVLGRWAIEFYSGKELLDRVRFNVPGMGDAPRTDDKRVLKKPAMDRITTHFEVHIADNPRTTSAKLVDRATGEETPIPWPPGASTAASASASAPTADAGPPKASASPSAAPVTPPKASASPSAAPVAPPKASAAPTKPSAAPTKP